MTEINKRQWEKTGLFFQISRRRYLLASGPFIPTSNPNPQVWTVFNPPYFYSSPTHYWYQPVASAVFSKKKLQAFLGPIPKRSVAIQKINGVGPDFINFKKIFNKIMKQIKKGPIQKIVPVFFETSSYQWDTQDLSWFIHCLLSHSKGWAYARWTPQELLIGNTPEYLFKKQGLLVQTMALAGTARSPSHNLLKDDKEKKEHQWVVQGIRSALQNLGSLECSNKYVDSIGKLQHLRTDFRLKLKAEISFNKLCDVLHPTPALGGWPPYLAHRWLYRLQKQTGDKKYFGAPFGLSYQKQALCLVAIRNMYVRKNKMYIGSGCGLVKDSQLEREWEELKLKRQFIKDILF